VFVVAEKAFWGKVILGELKPPESVWLKEHLQAVWVYGVAAFLSEPERLSTLFYHRESP
jgi:hypothetical protein